MWNDVRLAARLLLKDRGFSLAAMTALALGIAANITVFTLFNGAFLRDLPVEAPDRMVAIQTRTVKDGEVSIDSLSYPDLVDLQASARAFDGIAGVTEAPMNVADEAYGAERFVGAYISANGFRLLGDRPVLGRDFRPEDDRAGAQPVVMLGYTVWQRRYQRDPAIVGRVVRVNGSQSTVIGVMPEGFGFPEIAEIWQPLAQLPGSALARRENRSLDAFGRLKPDVTLEQSAAELGIIAAGLARQYPDTNRDAGVEVTPYQDGPGGAIRGVFGAMMGAVAFLLLIACANVANLLLARGARRSREMSVRMALGATRAHVTRQLLVESLLLSITAGLIGLALAAVGVQILTRAIVTGPYWLRFPFDGRVFAFVATLSIVTAVLFGLLPALRVSTSSLITSLNAVGRGSTAGPLDRRWSGGLVVVQLTLTLVLLTGAGLLLRSVASQYQYNAGVDTNDLIIMRVELPEATYPGNDGRRQFYRQLEERLAVVPGMRAAIGSAAPLLGGGARPISVDGDPRPVRPSRATVVFVGSRYFDVIGITPVRGRLFTDADGPGRPTVVVNQQFATLYFPNEDPLGHTIQLGARFDDQPSEWLTIIGIVPNVRHEDNDPREVEDAVYLPFAANPLSSAAIIVRSPLDTGTVARTLRDQVRALDPDLPVFGVTTLEDAFAQTFRTVELLGSLFGIFAAAALMLATIGLYGVTAYSVAQRTQEIGVRIALGARASQVWWIVARRVVVQLAIGLSLGLAGAAATGQLLEGFLWGVGDRDPVTFVSVTTLLVAVALAASFVPARRAMWLDPVAALRSE